MSWFDVLTTAESATIYAVAGTLTASAIAVFVAWRTKALQHWRAHRAAQKAILANQKTILGDRFERPAA